MALNNRQQLFITEYLRTFNATTAYQTVYPDVNRATAAVNGCRYLKNKEIAAAINVRMSESAMSADEVLMRLAEEARAEYSNYIIGSPRLDMVRMAQDGKADLIPQVIDDHGNIDILQLVRTGQIAEVADYILQPGYVDIAAMERDGKKHLIKGIKPTQYGLAVEFYDAQAALGMIGKKHGLFIDKSETRNFDIDLSKLTNEQLERVAAGDDPMMVVLDGYIAATKSGS